MKRTYVATPYCYVGLPSSMVNSRSMASYNVIVILGPTASGKSSLGVKLAKKFHGVVISADSRQVYHGMDLGTGKVTKKEMSGVPHYLLDVASPRSQYTVARYVRDVTKVLKKIAVTTPIFLVGGSPFYIDALTKPNAFSAIPPNPTLRRQLATKSTNQLIHQLTRLHPTRAITIDTHNRRRMIRAIEIASTNILPPSIQIPPMRVLKLGITIDKNKLYRNITRRIDARIRQGMLREIQRLHDQGLSWNKLDAFGLEYRFLSRHLRGQLTKDEAINQLNKATQDFTKRQMTWWKRDSDIHWISKKQKAVQLIRDFLR